MSKVPVLQQIAAKVSERLKTRQERVPLDELEAKLSLRNSSPVRSLESAFPKGELNIIAEVKRASPSEGDIAPGIDPIVTAGNYLRAGAAAVSVLTEPDFFKGDLFYLMLIRQAFPDAFLLMKDFIVDQYQICEGALAGASCILLIMALLDDRQARMLLDYARGLGLHALVEVHDKAEMERAKVLGAKFIGVNNRDLKTMKIDTKTSQALAPLAPNDAILVSESGLGNVAECFQLMTFGYQAFLIGTTFMKTPDPGRALARWIDDED